jgi:molybdopterin molybdotransferase
MKDMLGREEALSVGNAREVLLKAVTFPLLKEIDTDIEHSLNRIISRDIISPEDLPGFTRSTMDGYAVHSSDTFGAREGMPSYLNLAGEIFMGEAPGFMIKKSEAAKIATGGMLPEGADAVIMIEHTSEASNDLIEVLKPVAPGENTIQSGEDCKKDELVLRKGHKIRPQDI